MQQIIDNDNVVAMYPQGEVRAQMKIDVPFSFVEEVAEMEKLAA